MKYHWKRTDSKLLFKNNYWTYNLDKFQIVEKDFEGEYHYVRTLGSTMIIPVTDEGKIVLVRQYRYLFNRESIEFPCGGVKPNTTIDENAQIELREETGFSSEELIKIGENSPCNGIVAEMCHVYIANKLVKAPLEADATEEFGILLLTIEEVDEFIKNGKIWDGMSLAAWMQGKHYIKTQ